MGWEINRDYLEEKFRAIHKQLDEMAVAHKEHLAADRVDFDKVSQMILILDRAKQDVHAAMDKRLDRLEVVQANRSKHFGYVWTALAGIAATLIGLIFGK